MKMDRNRIISIQQFWGAFSYICNGCGQEIKTEAVVYEEQTPTKIKMSCPDCGQYLGWAKLSKVLRIFKNIKEGLVEIETIDRGWLKWALSINHTGLRSQLHREAAQRRIDSVDPDPTPDYRMTDEEKKRVEYMQRADYLGQEIDKLSRKRAKLSLNTEDLSYSEIVTITKKSRDMGSVIGMMAKEKYKVLNWLAENPAL